MTPTPQDIERVFQEFQTFVDDSLKAEIYRYFDSPEEFLRVALGTFLNGRALDSMIKLGEKRNEKQNKED
jgi:hypothetical protein